ncbi:hypothetical protein Poli38472_014475 [Pythium oligandrum]|uniref:Secreted protein n=1 Tax=Pythium oligandrum TaxID=41045 RepID=A0A8K1CCT1_PYTOL|nr:hypothetical protein Poli38472_014475 [Pythium oligandrum]|eukprot:TMW61014.1 hypothetical protein Poli38472_014475 [Pythium oligandrum]
MLQRLATLTALVAAATTLADASSDAQLKPVVTIQARVQGDTPLWDGEKKEWTGSYGNTIEEKYRSVLDTVNTASVEGALMYVQAEGINQREQSVKCVRKNKMKNIVFYEVTTVQPTAAVNFYARKHPVRGHCPFVAMDGGKCTNAGADIPDTCKQYDGLDNQPKLGHCVGANEQSTDPRAPYPNNYWYSYPSSCVAKYWNDKTDECRQQFAGGLCPYGEKPDGEKCTFSYKILGYVTIDDVVGITDPSRMPEGKAYSSFAEFCQAGGVEFDAENTGHGFDVKQSLPFWQMPGEPQANAKRAEIMMDTYNKISNSTSTNMTPLPSVTELTSKNPPCYESTPECVNAQFGCKRTLYSQLCVPCANQDAACTQSPPGYVFPGSQ